MVKTWMINQVWLYHTLLDIKEVFQPLMKSKWVEDKLSVISLYEVWLSHSLLDIKEDFLSLMKSKCVENKLSMISPK